MSVGTCRTELQAARTEIERLKKDLAAKNAELATKEQSSDVIKAVQPQEMQELQQKLLHLRKEQQSADAARDKAWKQLKVTLAGMSVFTQLCNACGPHNVTGWGCYYGQPSCFTA